MPNTFNILRLISHPHLLLENNLAQIFNSLPHVQFEFVNLNLLLQEEPKIGIESPFKSRIYATELNKALFNKTADLALFPSNELPYPLSEELDIVALIENKSDLSKKWVLVSLSHRSDLKVIFYPLDLRQTYGKVQLVGFGPGDPDLLTIGGDKALSQADIIFHDDLLDKEFLKKYSGEKFFVGKRKGHHFFEQGNINLLMLEAAQAGKQVVRLKGGDPMVFAHGGEEVEYLQRNFVKVKLIPGVSSGIAVASLTKVPLTHRGISSSVSFVSGHSDQIEIPKSDTLVYYMAGTNINSISKKIIQSGRNPQTPVMLVHNVSLPNQQEFFSTLSELASSQYKYPTPIIIVIGNVVSLKNQAAEDVVNTTIYAPQCSFPKKENSDEFLATSYK